MFPAVEQQTVAAHREGAGFAIGAKRIAPLWRLLDGIPETGWTEATGMAGAQVAGSGALFSVNTRPDRRSR